MNFIEIFKLVVQLLPLLIEAIKAVEAAMPGKGQGEIKLGLIRSALEASYHAAGQIEFNDIWSVLAKMIDGIVKLFNSTGVFSK